MHRGKASFLIFRFAFLAVFCGALSTAGFTQQSASPESPAPQPQASNGAPPEFAEARKLMQQGKFDEAIDQLQAVETRDPNAKGLALEMGTAYYKKSDFPKAIEYLKKATAADPANSEAIQLLGLSDYLGGHPADAIPLLEKVQGWFSRANVDASYILGICYIQTKNYDQARRAFAKMFDVPSDSAASYLFTARMLLRQEYDPVAEEYAQKAVALDPKLPLVHFLLGELYLYKSRVPEAIVEFQKELALNPANAATYYKLGDAYSRVQKFEEAERVLQRSIWLDSTSTGPYILMGKVLEKKGEFDLAVRALQRAASMDPNNPTTHHLLGQAYRDMGKKEEAESELKLAEELQTKQTAR
ncbi:MAG TPA: tetratricopeptide repeat protein [Candidatus Sulfotelmatobacter sp.]|jgi:tetratricopeptide (TPR) repeat protein|nr:tetratricopeptide repeat protein [Candidatus Sulfotelmatobacter sp.]